MLILGTLKTLHMRKYLFQILLIGGVVLFSDTMLTSCASSKHCPAVAGTGNSSSRRGGLVKAGKCPATAGTGNYKPKVRRKPQDGLMSAKMERQMAKSKKKKAGPIEKRKLSMDQ